MGLVGVTIKSNSMFSAGRFCRSRESTTDIMDFMFSPSIRHVMLCFPEVKKQFKYRGHLFRVSSSCSTRLVVISTFAKKSSAFLMSVPIKWSILLFLRAFAF